MKVFTRALRALPRARRGGVTIEQGLIAALIGVVVVSVVTTLSTTIDSTAQGASVTDESSSR